MTVTDSSTSTDRASPGTVVGGRYTLRTAVGHGGMGAVWQATDIQLGREVAVKEVAPPPGISREERDGMYQRMLREARAAAAMSHPSVVRVYDVVTDGGRPWVVMELLDARSLADIVLADGALAPRAVAKIGVALLGALEVAHAAGVLHRDVKPANVLVCTDGRCVLTDFGVARLPSDAGLTTPGMVLGSPHFISPERALGAAFGPPSDLFSLGVTLFTAVEGRPPFDKGDPIATMHSVVEDEPAAAQRAGPLADVLSGLLEKDPQRRWDAPRAREQLRELLAGRLASTSRMFPTDPMSVVPPQREAEPVVHHAGDQIGGRALLPPDAEPATGPAAEPAAEPAAGPAALRAAGHHDPYTAVPDPYGHLADAYRGGSATGAYPDPYAGPSPDPYAGSAVPRQRQARGTPRPGLPRAAAGLASGALVRLGAAARQLPRGVQLGTLAGVAAAVVAGTFWLLSPGGDPDQGPPATPGGAGPTLAPTSAPPEREPLVPVQQFAERGVVVNLPDGWEEIDRTEIRVDFNDPSDPDARIRLLQEPSGADAMRFIEIIEPNISCPDPYERESLSEIELAGEPAALLEYVCGSGDDTRHSLWATVVRDGTAYSFYLSVPESQIDERRPIFEEMIASFRFA